MLSASVGIPEDVLALCFTFYRYLLSQSKSDYGLMKDLLRGNKYLY